MREVIEVALKCVNDGIVPLERQFNLYVITCLRQPQPTLLRHQEVKASLWASYINSTNAPVRDFVDTVDAVCWLEKIRSKCTGQFLTDTAASLHDYGAAYRQVRELQRVGAERFVDAFLDAAVAGRQDTQTVRAERLIKRDAPLRTLLERRLHQNAMSVTNRLSESDIERRVKLASCFFHGEVVAKYVTVLLEQSDVVAEVNADLGLDLTLKSHRLLITFVAMQRKPGSKSAFIRRFLECWEERFKRVDSLNSLLESASACLDIIDTACLGDATLLSAMWESVHRTVHQHQFVDDMCSALVLAVTSPRTTWWRDQLSLLVRCCPIKHQTFLIDRVYHGLRREVHAVIAEDLLPRTKRMLDVLAHHCGSSATHKLRRFISDINNSLHICRQCHGGKAITLVAQQSTLQGVPGVDVFAGTPFLRTVTAHFERHFAHQYPQRRVGWLTSGSRIL